MTFERTISSSKQFLQLFLYPRDGFVASLEVQKSSHTLSHAAPVFVPQGLVYSDVFDDGLFGKGSVKENKTRPKKGPFAVSGKYSYCWSLP